MILPRVNVYTFEILRNFWKEEINVYMTHTQYTHDTF